MHIMGRGRVHTSVLRCKGYMRVLSVLQDSLVLSFETVSSRIRQSLPEPGVHRTGVTDAQNRGYGCIELELRMHRTRVTDAQKLA